MKLRPLFVLSLIMPFLLSAESLTVLPAIFRSTVPAMNGSFTSAWMVVSEPPTDAIR
jgi:hypothetical protein